MIGIAAVDALISFARGTIVVDRLNKSRPVDAEKCGLCGLCVGKCPKKALKT